MNELGCLLDRFWVTRSENKDLYFSIKRAMPQFRKFINEQLGWNLIVNESVVKLEKVPPKAMSWMGISSFQDSRGRAALIQGGSRWWSSQRSTR